MRHALRWGTGVAAILIATFLVLLLFRDVLLRHWLLYRFQTVSQHPAHLDEVRIHWKSGKPLSLHLSGLQITNTPGFGGGLMAHLPEVHVQVNPDALKERRLELQLLRVHLAELNVVRNQAGRTNLMELVRVMKTRAGWLDALTLAPSSLEFTGIQTLDLTAGTVRLLDLHRPARNQHFMVGLTNEILTNVQSTEDLTPLLLRIAFQELSRRLQNPSPTNSLLPR